MQARMLCALAAFGLLMVSGVRADTEPRATVFPTITVGEKDYLPEPDSIVDDWSDISISTISAKNLNYGTSVFLVKLRNVSGSTRSVTLRGYQGEAKPSAASVDLLAGVSADLELKLATINAAETPFTFELLHNGGVVRAAKYTLWVPPPMHTVVVDTEVPAGTKLIKWLCEWLSKPAPERLTVRMELYRVGMDEPITFIDCKCYRGRKVGAFSIPQLEPGPYVIVSKFALKNKPICALRNEFKIVEPETSP